MQLKTANTGGFRTRRFLALSLLLAAGGLSVWAAAAEQATIPSSTILTEQDAERIRRKLEKLNANQQQILAALDAIDAELEIVKVRVTR